VEQVNKAGGIKLPNGTVYKVATKFYDDENNKDRVQELYIRFITADN
jgi:branched-chain amino acid transport system substrate-binding protein